MQKGRLFTRRVGLLHVLTALCACIMLCACTALSAPAQYVIVISVDGLGGTYLNKIFNGTATGGPYAIPNFTRLKNEGASTLAAHCDNNNWETLPNHTSIMTARPRDNSPGFDGHNWSGNSDPTTTIHSNKGSYVASGFDVAHDNGLRTGMYANKSKFSLFDTYGPYTGGGSYNAINGALDTTGVDNGRDKIDNIYIDTTLGGIIVDTFITQQLSTTSRNQYAFLHINEPDAYGHSSGWGSATWNSQVVVVDTMLGKIFKLIEQDVPAMTGHTAIILTADHGNQDTPPTGADRYSVPFYVWGPGVAAGADLYTLNAGKRQVAASYPMTTYTNWPNLQPIRNAEACNLALGLLGLGPIPGSTFDYAQDLVLTAAVAPAVAITNPVNGATVGTNVLIEATATDSDGTITNVAFYADGGLLGSDVSAPYSFTWLGASNGTHALTAVAWDNTGLTATSAVVNVTVVLTPALLGVSPASYNFGTLATGATAQTSFTVTNLGGATLTGTAAAGAPFAVTGGSPYTIPGFGSAPVTVRFTPSGAGSFSNTVIFASNGGNATNLLSGSGAIIPAAGFTASPTNGAIPLAVTFTDTSLGTITNRWWDFGDGATTNTAATSLAHTYTAAGTNTVTLVASGPVGASTNTHLNCLVVLNAANSWLNAASGLWPAGTNWSLSVPPALSQIGILITNAGSKTVTINAGSTNTPISLSISNLTIAAPLGATNTLALQNVPGAAPLQVAGDVTLDGAAAVLVNQAVLLPGSNVVVGSAGSGNQMTITNGGVVGAGGKGTLGSAAGASNNAVIVTGSGSAWTNAGGLSIGSASPGNTLTVANGASLQNTFCQIGTAAGANGNAVLINGARWTNATFLTVGASGSGNTLTITNGGYVQDSNGTIGSTAGASNCAVTVTGSGSLWTNTNTLVVGSSSRNNSLTVSAGARVTVAGGDVTVGNALGANGNTVLLTGAGAALDTGSQGLNFGRGSAGNLLVVSNGAALSAYSWWLSGNRTDYNSGGVSNNTIVVTGSGSTFTGGAGTGTIADRGAGSSLIVSNGGTATMAGAPYFYRFSGANSNAIVVTGSGSAWNTGGLNNPATNSVGQSNTISVVNGGQWQAAGLVYLPGSYNTLLVNSGGLVELGGGLQLNGTADTVTNAGGILQFTSATPPLTISGTGAGVTLVSGTLAYRGVTNVDLNANAGGAGTVGAFTWAGVNTLRLNASTSTTVSAYTFANNLGAKNYAGLELVGGTNRLGNAIILDGSHGGTLLLSNTTAVIAGGVTLVGPVPVTSLATSTLAGMLSGGTSGALVKLGAGTLTLAAANTYAGATTVSNGTLELVTVASLGTNTLDISTAGAAQVKLSYAVTATNGGLTFDGVTQAGGTWGGTGSGAAHVDPVHFAAGPGKLFVLSAPPPVASFSAAPTNGIIPLAVTFTDTSTGAITNRWWDFGDGVTTNITATNVVHTYVFAGSATVTLIVSGPGGAGTNTQTTLIVIALAPPAPPVLLPDNGFSVDVGTGAATLTFTATNGYQYRITYKDNLLSTNAWQPVPPPADGWHTATNNEPMTISDPGATNSPHRFYRIEAR